MPCPGLSRRSWQHVRSSAARPRAPHMHVRQDSAMHLYELACQLQCAATSVPPRNNLVYDGPDIRQRGDRRRPCQWNREPDGQRQQFGISGHSKFRFSRCENLQPREHFFVKRERISGGIFQFIFGDTNCGPKMDTYRAPRI